VFLELPGTAAHLEFTAGGAHCASAPHPESLLVLYLGDAAAVEAVVARLDADPVPPANPYWAEHGVTFEDPDGFRVVLVPERWGGERAGEVRVAEHAGPRAELRRLFELAEDSEQELGAYIDDGRVLVAIDGDQVVGHLQITETGEPGEAEVKNMAVDPVHQRRGSRLGSGRPDRRFALGLLGVLAGPLEALDELGSEVGVVQLHRHQAFREKHRVAPVRGVCDDHDVRHRSCSCAELTRSPVRSVGRGLKVIAGSFSAQKARVCGPSRCQ
jgi:hypothetical protein